MLRTKEMCTPRLRWIPEQARQKKMPNLGEAYVQYCVSKIALIGIYHREYVPIAVMEHHSLRIYCCRLSLRL